MAVTTEQIKSLREKTGAGIMDSKRALEQTDGNIDKAVEVLRQQGLARAGKKSDRTALQGLVDQYIHNQGRIGALIEINCETDFVARTDSFKTLAHDVAMQVAATAPRFVSAEEVSEEEFARLDSEFGDRKAATEAAILLDQIYIKDPKKTIRDLINEHISLLGENIVIRRFARFELGEGQSAEA
jgi:elongation factor Ts